MRVLGFMSGTSLDGVDVAVLETDGDTIEDFGPTTFLAYSHSERSTIERATRDALLWDGYGKQPDSFSSASVVIHDTHLRAARQLLAKDGKRFDLIGFHGQTVLHRADRRLSVQIGDAGALARELQVPVVAAMRQGDLDAGGQGAPLVPIYHAALAETLGLMGPTAFLNIGGVANITWLGCDSELVAFDTGPGNGLIDQLIESRGAGSFDKDGAFAAAGKVDTDVVDSYLKSPFFFRTGPKSVDRYDFSLDPVEHLSIEDAAATLTTVTADAVVLAAANLPELPMNWLICGGGRHNPTLMAALADRLGNCRPIDELGLRGDFIEAEAMAYLAARSVRGLPITYPGTTGVDRPTTGGQLWRA